MTDNVKLKRSLKLRCDGHTERTSNEGIKENSDSRNGRKIGKEEDHVITGVMSRKRI